MSPSLEDRYLEWLYSQFGAVRNGNPARSYWQLSITLHAKEFVWLVANDDNRVEDGKSLRDDFIREQGSDGVTDEWMTLGCSVLEMLVALAFRAADQTEVKPEQWIEIFFKHLGLLQYTDELYEETDGDVNPDVEEIIERLIYRNYQRNGVGGLFPLNSTRKDQRKVELWYQMSAYIIENDIN